MLMYGVDPLEVQHRCSRFRLFKRKAQRAILRLCQPNAEPIKSTVKPIFIVGCGHSGTTLLASLLFQHPSVLPIPLETNYFHPIHAPFHSLRMFSQWSAIAKSQEKYAIVEKSPKNIHRIGEISKFILGSKFIFVCREPVECVASLNRRFNDLSFCTERYCLDNQAGIEWLNCEMIKKIKLEELLSDTERTMRELQKFCGLEFSTKTLNPSINFYDLGGSSGLMSHRVQQMSELVTKPSSEISSQLSEEDISFVLSRTLKVAEALGY